MSRVVGGALVEYATEHADVVADALVQFVRQNPCENYGYDYKDFRRLCKQRARAVRVLLWSPRHVYWSALRNWDRFWYDTCTGQFGYDAGQSRNEELTNLFTDLAGIRRRGWLS